MVSYDVVWLFINMTIQDYEEIVRGLTTSGLPEDFPELVEHFLRNTFFLWNGDYYELTEGAAMGSPLRQKSAHTDRYLNANSHHHPSQKAALMSTLMLQPYTLAGTLIP
ncbi:uncharacterized protein [Hetaerina americana]|uniref:uncharacterized protein n=1 Tax=Hetaerina americana TaxID=62018 RepID=UPI003A7F44A3